MNEIPKRPPPSKPGYNMSPLSRGWRWAYWFTCFVAVIVTVGGILMSWTT